MLKITNIYQYTTEVIKILETTCKKYKIKNDYSSGIDHTNDYILILKLDLSDQEAFNNFYKEFIEKLRDIQKNTLEKVLNKTDIILSKLEEEK